jgi:hypothetical protein
MAEKEYYLGSENHIGLDGAMRLWIKPGAGGGGAPTIAAAFGAWAFNDPWLIKTGAYSLTATKAIDQRVGVGSGRLTQPGRATYFDGTSYVSVGATSETVKSVSFWMKPDDITAHTDGLLRMQNGGSDIQLVNGTITVNHTGGTDKIRVNDVDTAVIANTTTWHHVYIEFTTAHAADSFTIGRDQTLLYTGYMFDVRTYNRVLTADEITSFGLQAAAPCDPVDTPDDHELGYYLDEGHFTGAYNNGTSTNIVQNRSVLVSGDASTPYEGNDVPYSIQNLYGWTDTIDFLALDEDEMAQSGTVVITPRVAGEDLTLTGGVSGGSAFWQENRLDTMWADVIAEWSTIGYTGAVATPLLFPPNGSQTTFTFTVGNTEFTTSATAGGGANRWSIGVGDEITVTDWIVKLTLPVPLNANGRTTCVLPFVPAQYTGVVSQRVNLINAKASTNATTTAMAAVTHASNEITGSISMFAWFNPTTGHPRIIAGNASFKYRFMDLGTDNKFDVYIGNGSNWDLKTSQGTLVPDVWQHVCVVYDGPNGVLTTYINGIATKRLDMTVDRMATSDSEPLFIDSFEGVSSFNWEGGMAGFGLADKVLSHDEVIGLVKGTLPATGITTYYPMLEGGGNVFYDIVAAQHNTYSGNIVWTETIDELQHNVVSGCSLYTHASLADVYVPYDDSLVALSITPETGYSLDSHLPAVTGINMPLCAINFNPEPDAPFTRFSDSIPTAWVMGDGDVSGLTVTEEAGQSHEFVLGEYSDP